jgi:hypothetical protein
MRATTAYWACAGVEHLQHRLVAKARIGPDPQLSDVTRDTGKTTGQNPFTPTPSAGVTGTKFRVPQETRIGFQTQERIVGAFAAITRIVTDRCPFLPTEDRDDGTIQIQDQP